MHIDSERGDTARNTFIASFGAGACIAKAVMPRLRSRHSYTGGGAVMAIRIRAAVAAAALAMGALAMAAPARAEGVKAGVLTCNVASGWGFIFGSSRRLRCSFSQTSGLVERYVGHIRKFGVDIGYQSGGIIVWGVFAPTVGIGKGALAGDYGGATGSAAVGVGAGANVLVGGFQNSITLQPVSIEGTTGLNVAAGIAEVTLSPR